MTSQSTSDWLMNSKQRGMKLGLQSTQHVLQLMNIAHSPFTIHIAGSNGKGSLCAYLTCALNAVSRSTLTFTSPHLVSYEERFRINGVPIDSELALKAAASIQRIDEETGAQLTFFEITCLMALWLAETLNVDYLLLETGLGGRYDATRVANADLCVVTSLSVEHTDVLGSNLVEIAREKAAICRPGGHLIVREPEDENVKQAIEHQCQIAGLTELGEPTLPGTMEYVTIPAGISYLEEASLLAQTVWKQTPIGKLHQFPQLQGVCWPARMQWLDNPLDEGFDVLLDGAHNPSGMRASVKSIERDTRLTASEWCLIFGTSPQTNMEEMIAPLRSFLSKNPPQSLVFTEPQFGRYPGMPTRELQPHFDELGLDCYHYPTIVDAIAQRHEWLKSSTKVLSIGSLYLQGNLLQALNCDDSSNLSIRAKQ